MTLPGKRRRNNRPFFINQKLISLAVIIFALAVLSTGAYYAYNVAAPVESPQQDLENDKPERPDPLVITWEYAAIGYDPASIGPMPSVQIVSPTWFHITDQEGTISSQFDSEYLAWARERGYDIWALVTNNFDPEITAAFLSNEEVRQNIVEELIGLALEYDLEGLNIDFENFHADYRDLFTEFISEMAERCREENIILSVDVTMLSTSAYWSLGYDRAALAEAADYIILMAYDEHWASSPVAGSVASLPWVESGLRQVLKEVPPEKLILGIPFYTRLWEIDESGEQPAVLNSWSYSMHRAEDIIEDNEAEIEWDGEARQNTASYSKDGLTYKMWLEDTTSISYRLELAHRYELAGIAGWRRGLENEEVWELIDDWLSAVKRDNE